MTYLLDTQVVSFFFQARRHDELAAAAASSPLAIVDDVHGELAEDPTRGALFRRWFPTSHIELRSVEVGSAEEALLTRLATGLTTSRGRGERASIAVAATDARFVFTGMDRGAMWIALRELWTPGERLIGLPVFLRRMVELAALPREAADDVMRHSNQVLPTWWADWRAG